MPLKLRHDIRVHVCMRWLRKNRLLQGPDPSNVESNLPHEIGDSPGHMDLAQQVVCDPGTQWLDTILRCDRGGGCWGHVL